MLGQWLGSEESVKRSQQEHVENCVVNHYAKSCYTAGYNYYHGRGTEENKAKAFETFSRGCYDSKTLFPLDVGLPCLKVGEALVGADEEMKDIPKDGKKGLEALDKACSVGLIDACEVLLAVYGNGTSVVKENHELALKIAQKCCERNSIDCCNALYHQYKMGIGTEKDLVKAEETKKKLDKLVEQSNMNFQSGNYT